MYSSCDHLPCIYKPTEHSITEGLTQCSLAMRAGVSSYIEDHEETSKMHQQRLLTGNNCIQLYFLVKCLVFLHSIYTFYETNKYTVLYGTIQV